MFHDLPGQQKSDHSEQSDGDVDAPHEYPSASLGQNLIRLAFLYSIQRHFEARPRLTRLPEKWIFQVSDYATYQGSERQPANISAFLVGNPARLGRSHSGERICSLSPAFRQGSQCIDPSPTSRRNSRSSTGAPLSRISATITPSEGEFGSVRICFPAIAD